MDGVGFVLVAINVAAGLVCALPVGHVLKAAWDKQTEKPRFVAFLGGVYLIECFALALGMTIPVLNIGLAFIWGALFGLWVSARMQRHQVLKAALYTTLYTCIPTVSILVIPLLAHIKRWDVLSAEQGVRFGIPEFLHLPVPLNTILGFYVALVIGTVILKLFITLGAVRLFVRARK